MHLFIHRTQTTSQQACPHQVLQMAHTPAQVMILVEASSSFMTEILRLDSHQRRAV